MGEKEKKMMYQKIIANAFNLYAAARTASDRV